MTKPETPLQLISTVVNCLTVVIEDETVEPGIRAACEPIREAAVDVALDLQLGQEQAA